MACVHPRVCSAGKLTGANIYVPADPSSAAFPVAAGADSWRSPKCAFDDVLVNPLRLGFYETLLEMGAQDRLRGAARSNRGADRRSRGERQQTSWRQRRPRKRAPAMIDEFPILAVVAAFGGG